MNRKSIILIIAFFIIQIMHACEIKSLKNLCLEAIQNDPMLHYNAQITVLNEDLIHFICKEEKNFTKLNNESKHVRNGRISLQEMCALYQKCNSRYRYLDYTSPRDIIEELHIYPDSENPCITKQLIAHTESSNIFLPTKELAQLFTQASNTHNDLFNVHNILQQRPLSPALIQYILLQVIQKKELLGLVDIIQPIPPYIAHNVIFTAGRYCLLNEDNAEKLLSLIQNKNELAKLLHHTLKWTCLEQIQPFIKKVESIQCLINSGIPIQTALLFLCHYAPHKKAFYVHDESLSTLCKENSIKDIAPENIRKLIQILAKKTHPLSANPYLITMTYLYHHYSKNKNENNLIDEIFYKQFLTAYLLTKTQNKNPIIDIKYKPLMSDNKQLIKTILTNRSHYLGEIFSAFCKDPISLKKNALNYMMYNIEALCMFLEHGIDPNNECLNNFFCAFINEHTHISSIKKLYALSIQKGISNTNLENNYKQLVQSLTFENITPKTRATRLECLTILNEVLKKHNCVIPYDRATIDIIKDAFFQLAINTPDNCTIPFIKWGKILGINKKFLKEINNLTNNKTSSCITH